ncbi:MAG: hypothetical protein LBD23_09640 [Oscillospiraceae bacterium]|jgi:hypothetical protein|nr:hypothetical protein [Oscillospiraceae bacterium]
MLFQVLRNNTVMMSTAYDECIPPHDILRQMVEAGYTLKKITSRGIHLSNEENKKRSFPI